MTDNPSENLKKVVMDPEDFIKVNKELYNHYKDNYRIFKPSGIKYEPRYLVNKKEEN